MIKIGTIIGFHDSGFNKTIYGVILGIDNDIPAYHVRLCRIWFNTFGESDYIKHSEWWIGEDNIIYVGEEPCSQ